MYTNFLFVPGNSIFKDVSVRWWWHPPLRSSCLLQLRGLSRLACCFCSFALRLYPPPPSPTLTLFLSLCHSSSFPSSILGVEGDTSCDSSWIWSLVKKGKPPPQIPHLEHAYIGLEFICMISQVIWVFSGWVKSDWLAGAPDCVHSQVRAGSGWHCHHLVLDSSSGFGSLDSGLSAELTAWVWIFMCILHHAFNYSCWNNNWLFFMQHSFTCSCCWRTASPGFGRPFSEWVPWAWKPTCLLSVAWAASEGRADEGPWWASRVRGTRHRFSQGNPGHFPCLLDRRSYKTRWFGLLWCCIPIAVTLQMFVSCFWFEASAWILWSGAKPLWLVFQDLLWYCWWCFVVVPFRHSCVVEGGMLDVWPCILRVKPSRVSLAAIHFSRLRNGWDCLQGRRLLQHPVVIWRRKKSLCCRAESGHVQDRADCWGSSFCLCMALFWSNFSSQLTELWICLCSGHRCALVRRRDATGVLG